MCDLIDMIDFTENQIVKSAQQSFKCTCTICMWASITLCFDFLGLFQDAKVKLKYRSETIQTDPTLTFLAEAVS